MHVVNTANRLFLTPRYIPNVHINLIPATGADVQCVVLQSPCSYHVVIGLYYCASTTTKYCISPCTELLAHKWERMNVLLVSQHAFYHAC